MRYFFILFIIFFISGTKLFSDTGFFPAYSAYKAYQEKDFSKAQDILETKQVEQPNNPLINYNLGTIYYRQNKLDMAKESFNRTISNIGKKNNSLLEKTHLNTGNCFYKTTLAMLPENWESDEKALTDELRNKAIQEIKLSIENYDKSIKINSNNEPAKTNKKAAEEILNKLNKNKDKKDKDKQEQKKQEQDKQDKQDKDKQEQKKQEQDKQDKQKPEEKQKEQKQDKQEEKKPEQKQDQAQNREQKQVQATLEKLDQNEKDLQKQMFKQKVEKNKQAKAGNQKPW